MLATQSKTAEELNEIDGIFREHHSLVFRTACAVTGSSEDAEDVLQTIFLRLLRRGIPPNFHKNPKGYLYKAAINVSVSVLRSRRRHRSIPDTSFFEAAPSIENSGFFEIIAELSPRTVEVLVLRYVYDYTDAEIARMLGRSRGTIAVLLFRARARLRKRIHFSGENR